MALVIRFYQLVADFAELARLGHVTRARIAQIMNLLHLAPDIQEAILFLPRVERGEDPPEARIHRLADALDADEHKKSPTVWAGLGRSKRCGYADLFLRCLTPTVITQTLPMPSSATTTTRLATAIEVVRRISCFPS